MKFTPANLTAMGYGIDGRRLQANAKAATDATASEAQLHREILDYCRARGWPVVHSRMDVPQTAGVGTPDFVVALPGGRTLWVEAKSKKGKLRPEQAAWMAALRAVEHEACVVRSMGDFFRCVEQVIGIW